MSLVFHHCCVIKYFVDVSSVCRQSCDRIVLYQDVTKVLRALRQYLASNSLVCCCCVVHILLLICR